MLRLLDTFAGIGGFSFAAERLIGGFETTQFVEWNPFCQQVLNQHWPAVPIHGDIQTFHAEIGQFDVITGGFPCQDISAAGKQAGIKVGTRSGMFYELIRLICEIRPKYVVLENVSAICSAQPDIESNLSIVLGALSEVGYDAEWDCIRASSLGAPHHRNRWWLVAYPNSEGIQGLRGECQLREAGSEITAHWRSSGGAPPAGWEQKRCEIESPLLRVDDGLPNWVDRIKALGNSVVPQVAAIPLERVMQLESERG